MAPKAAVLLLPGLVARAVPFVLNTFTVSRTSAVDLGIAAQVELVVSCGLELLRDPLRHVVTSNKQVAINISFVSLALYLIIIPIILYSLFGLSQHVLILFVAHVLELIAEPYLLISQYINLEFGRRSTLESIASLLKCGVQTYVTFQFDNYVLAFSLGELAYSAVLFGGYLIFFGGKVLIPKTIKVEKGSPFFIDKSTWTHYKSSIIQQIVKLFLSQGDKFLISSLLPLEDQGYYALVDNYGSLVPRLIFAPLEESTRINVKAQLESSKPIDLGSTFDIYCHFLPLLTVFGPININFVMTKLLHRHLPQEVESAFPLYLLSLPLLGINGILEALTVVIFKDQTNKHSVFMTMNAFLFYFCMILFVSYFNWGLPGFIIANMVNSSTRILWNQYHLSSSLSKLKLSIPHMFLLTVVASGLVQLTLFGVQVSTWYQFIQSGVCGAICVASAIVPHLKFARISHRNEDDKKKKDQ